MNQTNQDHANSPFVGEHPQEGDLVRITRTTTRVYEGYWRPCDPDEESDSGHAFIENAEEDRRVRTEGPVAFDNGRDGTYTEADTIEVIEHRDGAPYEDILIAEVATARAEREARNRKPSWRERRNARRARRRNVRHTGSGAA